MRQEAERINSSRSMRDWSAASRTCAGASETVRDGTAHGDPMREFCEQVLATDDKDRKR